jgi:hypothetical protein
VVKARHVLIGGRQRRDGTARDRIGRITADRNTRTHATAAVSLLNGDGF